MNKPEKAVLVHDDLLIELGCEELPPKGLPALAAALFAGFSAELEKAGLSFNAASSHVYYTPRRIALLISAVASGQADQVLERKGPAVAAAYDADKQATPAALGFARSVGKSVDELEVLKTEKGEWLYCQITKPGKPLDELVFPMLEKALTGLPIARPMRWANNDFSFIRPVHWLVALHGSQTISGGVFGLTAGNTTHGHRIHSPGPHKINSAGDYLQVLKAASVIADQDERKKLIKEQVLVLGESAGGKALIEPQLLEEVSNLLEWPHAVLGGFDSGFLQVPAEALIASMQDHQKFFPVVDTASETLMARFIAVANLESKDFDAVRHGFERVIRPRLADAQFFWDQDNKHTLQDLLPRLDDVVFQNKLGSVGDKSKRIGSLSKLLAEESGVDVQAAQRAGNLCKCDLVSYMVGEFPELQGTMGRYYAKRDGEDSVVAQAIGDHYLPAFSGDRLPTGAIGKVVSIADRLDTLAGIFATGLKPSGNKDPFALRRAALGLTRILLDGELTIELDKALAITALVVQKQIPVSPEVLLELRQFILDRLKSFLREQGYDTRLINAVFDAPLNTLPDLISRLDALKAFMTLDVSVKLAAANKRIVNIIRKSEHREAGSIREDRFVIAEEGLLFKEISGISENLDGLIEQADYSTALSLLAGLSDSIEAYFEKVMVMDKNPEIRANRLNMLLELKSMFDRIANFALVG